MTPWERRKAAVKEYSRLRPRTVYQSWVPTALVKQQTYPAGVFAVFTINYGVRESLFNVASEATGAQLGYSDESGVLYLTPAPADLTPINVVWRAEHVPDDLGQTFPTLPLSDEIMVDKLQHAIELEELAAELLDGPIKYSIGQTTTDRGGNPQELIAWAARLRNEVYLQLSVPLAELA